MPRTSAQNVVLAILGVGEGQWSGKVRLHKAFYFAHLYYANEHPGFLTDWPIAKLEHGPGIQNDYELFGTMQEEGLLEVELFHEGPYPEYRYRLTDKGKSSFSGLPQDAREAIERAAVECKSRSAAELSRMTHDHSRSWNEAKEIGDTLNIYIDIIPDDEYQSRKQRLRELTGKLGGIFGEASNATRS